MEGTETEIDQSHPVDFLSRLVLLKTRPDIDVTHHTNVSDVIFIET